MRLYSESTLLISAAKLTKYHEKQLELDRPRWMKSCKQHDMMQWADGVSLVNFTDYPPWPFPPREFSCLRIFRANKTDDGCTVLGRSILNTPEKEGFVKAIIPFGASIVEPYPQDDSKCIFKMFSTGAMILDFQNLLSILISLESLYNIEETWLS